MLWSRESLKQEDFREGGKGKGGGWGLYKLIFWVKEGW